MRRARERRGLRSPGEDWEGLGDGGTGIQRRQERSEKQDDKAGLALFRTVEPARMGEGDWRRAPKRRRVRERSSLLPPLRSFFRIERIVSPVGIPQRLAWLVWLCREDGVWSVEHGIWKQHAYAIHVGYPSEETSTSDLTCSSRHTITPIGVQVALLHWG